jgi:heme O synthase-like polyprenyltransferase
MVATLASIKSKLSFILVLISIIGLFALAWFKGVDIMTALPIILGMYVGSRSATSISHVIQASKDPNCDTASAIAKVEEKD